MCVCVCVCVCVYVCVFIIEKYFEMFRLKVVIGSYCLITMVEEMVADFHS